MSQVLYVDVIGGAAGDMLLAALLDAGAPVAAVQESIDCALPGRFRVETEEVLRQGMRARHLVIEQTGRGGGLDPRPFRDLTAALDAAPLAVAVRTRARAVLDRLGEAEATVHGLDPDHLALHDLGDDDTLLDVVGIAAALESLGVERIMVSPIPLGSAEMLPEWRGHPAVPLPAPVTAELLRGFPIRGARAEETVTPTAAAVFAALGKPSAALPSMTLLAAGYGAGTRDPSGTPNVVRVLVGAEPRNEGVEEELPPRDLLVLEANIDDLTPELLADAADALRGAGALDVWTAPVTMKKGRSGFVLSALCEPWLERQMMEIFFESTTTFGIRVYPVRRAELRREIVTVEVPEGAVRVKAGWWGGRLITATPEHDDVAEVARRAGRPVREVYEEAAVAARELRFERAAP
jgi:pyridinium-3,5-bisthiocarboxylic acid mononucleotide nickel chelatase